MRANINLLPRQDVQYDLWAPMALGVKPSPDPTINAVEKECLELFADVDKNKFLEIYNNGEPPAWGERVAGILKKNGYSNVTVHPGNDRDYFNNPSKLFPDLKKPYRIQPIGDLKEKIQNIFEFYKTQQWSIEEPKQGVCGHYYRGRMQWRERVSGAYAYVACGGDAHCFYNAIGCGSGKNKPPWDNACTCGSIYNSSNSRSAD